MDRYIIQVIVEPDGERGYIASRAIFEKNADLNGLLTQDMQTAEVFNRSEAIGVLAILLARQDVASASYDVLAS